MGLPSATRWALHLKGVPEQEIRSSGFVRDTLKVATWCFVDTTSYEDCALAAVLLLMSEVLRGKFNATHKVIVDHTCKIISGAFDSVV